MLSNVKDVLLRSLQPLTATRADTQMNREDAQKEGSPEFKRAEPPKLKLVPTEPEPQADIPTQDKTASPSKDQTGDQTDDQNQELEAAPPAPAQAKTKTNPKAHPVHALLSLLQLKNPRLRKWMGKKAYTEDVKATGPEARVSKGALLDQDN